MKEIRGNLFNHVGDANAICITTNGFTRQDGSCVMGRGCAKEACRMFPGIDRVLGKKLVEHGNVVHRLIEEKGTWVCSFPVKPVSVRFDGSNAVAHMRNRFKVGDRVPGWAALADPAIIAYSMQRLVRMADHFGWQKVILPRPGCGAGELQWTQIRKTLAFADDRFSFTTF